ncbi:uncharacterized protein TNIN_267461 [Trichonephila inaurata madagascariensis]|uniref:Uncharacterized protein n=1 Tax=Trichonephila inaurata madagascariensis TaxID=2747483 RepID=A0A8X6YDF7_9ARAC|nr:uncharacterized protein TNIN_267461 [Trichonephila inaurata madagascariensis]
MNDIGFPRSEEELNRMCPPFVEHQECTVIDVVKEICRTDSTLHINVTEHIGCLYNVTKYYSSNCSQTIKNNQERIIKYIEEISGEEPYTYQHRLWKSYDCLDQSLFFVCYSAQILEDCGHAAERLVRQLLNSIDYIEQFCPVSQHDDIKQLMAIMELSAEEVRALKKLFSME